VVESQRARPPLSGSTTGKSLEGVLALDRPRDRPIRSQAPQRGQAMDGRRLPEVGRRETRPGSGYAEGQRLVRPAPDGSGWGDSNSRPPAPKAPLGVLADAHTRSSELYLAVHWEPLNATLVRCHARRSRAEVPSRWPVSRPIVHRSRGGTRSACVAGSIDLAPASWRLSDRCRSHWEADFRQR
jgi:hypothetical protein